MGGHGAWGAMRSYRQDGAVTAHRLAPGTIRRIAGFARPYRGLIALLLLFVVAGSLLVAATPLLLQRIVDDGVAAGDRGLVVGLASLVVVVALAEAALSLAQRWCSSRLGENLIYDLRTAVFSHVQRQSIAFFTRTQTGSLVSRLNSDVIGAQQALTSTLGGVLSNVISVAVVLVTMLALSWQITLVALLVVPALLLPARRVGARLAGLSRESMQLNAELASRMTERFNVAGALLVRLYGRPADEDAQFAERAARVRDIGVRTAMSSRLFFAAIGAMASLATALVYGVGGWLAIDGAVTVGTLVAFAGLLGRLYGPVSALSNVQVEVMTALVSFERVFEVLDLEPSVADAPDAVDLPEGPLAVELDDVHFRYPLGSQVSIASLEPAAVGGAGPAVGGAVPATGGAVPATGGAVPATGGAVPATGGAVPAVGGAQPDIGAAEVEVLRGVSLRVEPGHLLALVGRSGAGKTTISALVSRLYDPTSGAVRIGGVDLRQARGAALRRALGVVTQDAHLFHDTIGANLRYAAPEADDEQLWQALRDAHVDDVVAALPQGLDTVVGDRGHRLSGGEKQRIALARLLLRSPGVVVLDEATAHLDSESELAVQRALDSALAGRTAIVIAHRLSTVRRADEIAVVDGGRIVERGTHAALLASGGLYAELYRTQFAGDEVVHH